jgi:hypothetical protein
MGHTHKPEALIWVDYDERIKTYVNTGDWIDHETYVLIKNGNVRLKNYSQQIHVDCDIYCNKGDSYEDNRTPDKAIN